MNIKELNESRTREDQSYLDVALGLHPREARKISFKEKLKMAQRKESEARNKEASEKRKAIQDHLNKGDLRQKTEYQGLVTLNRKKVSLMTEIKSLKKDLERLHKEYIQSRDTLSNVENGVNVNRFDLDVIEAASRSVQKYLGDIEAGKRKMNSLKESLSLTEKEIKQTARKVKEQYARAIAPQLVKLKKALQAADEANNELKYFANQVSGAVQVPCLSQFTDYSHYGATIINTGEKFIKSLEI